MAHGVRHVIVGLTSQLAKELRRRPFTASIGCSRRRTCRSPSPVPNRCSTAARPLNRCSSGSLRSPPHHQSQHRRGRL